MMKKHLYLFLLFLLTPILIAAQAYEATTLHIAAAQGNQKALKNLLKGGANVNVRDSQGNTPLHVADNLSTIKFLVENGADANAQNNAGLARLHLATVMGHFRIVSYLLSQKANPNIRDKNGTTPLHLAVDISYFENLILSAKDRFDAINATLMALPLIIQARAALADSGAALQKQAKEIGTFLIVLNLPVITAMSAPIASVQAAVRYRIVSLLIKNNAYLSPRDNNGNTPLHILAMGSLFKAPFKKSSFAMAEYMIVNGAKRDIRNKAGKTAYDIAKENNRVLLYPVLNPQGLAQKAERKVREIKKYWPGEKKWQPPVIPEIPYDGGVAR
jgi:ankyrin repeat protein